MRNIHWVMIMVGAIVVTAMISVMLHKRSMLKKLKLSQDNADVNSDETDKEKQSRIASLTAGFGKGMKDPTDYCKCPNGGDGKVDAWGNCSPCKDTASYSML